MQSYKKWERSIQALRREENRRYRRAARRQQKAADPVQYYADIICRALMTGLILLALGLVVYFALTTGPAWADALAAAGQDTDAVFTVCVVQQDGGVELTTEGTEGTEGGQPAQVITCYDARWGADCLEVWDDDYIETRPAPAGNSETVGAWRCLADVMADEPVEDGGGGGGCFINCVGV